MAHNSKILSKFAIKSNYQRNMNNNYQKGHNYQSNQNTPSIPSTPSNPSTQSIPSNRSTQNPQNLFLPQHGHYRHLRVYHVAEALYDLTYLFCRRFLSAYKDRTVDQMVQAARSGKQNIAEGNQAAATSSETEIKLTNVAKASIEELLTDYEDYLRTRQLPQWDANHPRFAAMRNWAQSGDFLSSFAVKAPKMSDEEMANLAITLCHQIISMLTHLLKTMQQRFVTQGGIKERMHAARIGYRQTEVAEIDRLRQENIALRQRIAQLENYIKNQNTQSNQNPQNLQSTQSIPSNQSTPSIPPSTPSPKP